jgi:hypothetical protein
MPRSIQEIESDIQKVGKRLQALNKELYEARCLASGVKVGDIVIASPRGDEEKEAIVRKIADTDFDPVWLIVSFKKKDGSWGSQERHTYGHWRKKGSGDGETTGPAKG